MTQQSDFELNLNIQEPRRYQWGICEFLPCCRVLRGLYLHQNHVHPHTCIVFLPKFELRLTSTKEHLSLASPCILKFCPILIIFHSTSVPKRATVKVKNHLLPIDIRTSQWTPQSLSSHSILSVRHCLKNLRFPFFLRVNKKDLHTLEFQLAASRYFGPRSPVSGELFQLYRVAWRRRSPVLSENKQAFTFFRAQRLSHIFSPPPPVCVCISNHKYKVLHSIWNQKLTNSISYPSGLIRITLSFGQSSIHNTRGFF